MFVLEKSYEAQYLKIGLNKKENFHKKLSMKQYSPTFSINSPASSEATADSVDIRKYTEQEFPS